ncbi:MAG: metallophosphoesterase [Methanomassiliicoccales archaeon]
MPSELRLGHDVILSALSCAYFPSQETVCISDLHLGYELYMESEGVFLPRLQVKLEMERMENILQHYRPARIVINGDLKQEFGRSSPQEWIEIRRLFEFLLSKTKVVVVRGNHDNYLLSIASKFDIGVVDSYKAGDILFAHGDILIDRKDAALIVIGHEHPAIRVRDAVGAQVKFPAFLYLASTNVLVLPAFSPFAAGVDAISESETFMSPFLHSMEPNTTAVFAIAGGEIRRVGTISDIRAVSEIYF